MRTALAFPVSGRLQKFVQPLRGIGGPTGIPVAQPDTVSHPWWQPGVQHYTIDIGQFEDQLHPALPYPTRLWGYGQGFSSNNPNWTRHLGGIIVARRGVPVQITFRNHLPANHILPIDTTIPGADGAQNRTATHLHGGFVPWVSDGGPQAWWDPNGNHGPSFVNVLNPTLAPNEAEYYYPNDQGARMVWYHDHAIGITRLNAYAGIASGYVITDDYEDSLIVQAGLPGPLDSRTIYLIFQDKVFVSEDIAATDPTWPTIMPNSRAGDLWYAHVGESETGESLPDPSEVPEFFGDTILVNGTAYPFLELEPRQYRLRLLNACNARFLNPRLVYAQRTDNTEPNKNAEGPAFVQIGTEGGFLPLPAMVNGPKQTTLLLGPAERADVIVDLRDIAPDSTLILYSDAPAPYPKGDEETDYHPHNPKTPTSIPGYGPNTRTLLQIRVKARVGPADPSITLPAILTPTDPFLVTQVPGVPTPIPNDVSRVRHLTLSETVDSFGRLIQFLGTNDPINPGAKNLLFGREFLSAPTEVIPAGSVEVWEIANLSGDTHPIHFHLVNVQVLSRQAFQIKTYMGGIPSYLGPAYAPDANELGWKETVRMNPGEVTRVLVKFNLPTVPFTVPLSTTTGVAGHEYVWHCHILEHEEHDMMRPLVVT
ncbi:MAG: multicopper oxidase domain-containing protein [Pseudogulbenkiania sp.]|nr:multicopper oxidase domain-containing protein [Pseudogulbenkiania sp.]